MDAERKARYKEKIKYVVYNLRIVKELVPDPNEIETLALYYALSTSIESVMDIIAMVVKNSGEVPKGDEYNINFIEKENFIESDTAIHLKKCNGLRNFLVHQYNGVDREIVLASVADVKKTLTQFIEIVEVYLNES